MGIKYIAYNPEGQRISGKLEVSNPQAAEQILSSTNLTVVSLKKELDLPNFSLALQKQVPTLFRPKMDELVRFNRELSTLLDSGISLLPAIKLIQGRIRGVVFKQVLTQVIRDIENGISFSEACSKHPAVFPSIYIRLATIGEATGRLGVMLKQAAMQVEKQLEMRTKIKKAIRYPAVVLLIGFIAFGILVTVTLPSLTTLLEEVGGELPWNARMLLATSDFFNAYGLYLFSGIGIAALLIWWYMRTSSGKIRKELLQRRVPLLKGVNTNSNMATFSRTLSTLLTAGIPLTEAIDLTISSTENTMVRTALIKVEEELMTGEQLSVALSRQTIFPEVVSQIVSMGEQTGSLYQNLEILAGMYERSTDESVDNLTGMIQPAVVIIAGGMVGFIMITLMQSVYGAIGQIK